MIALNNIVIILKYDLHEPSVSSWNYRSEVCKRRIRTRINPFWESIQSVDSANAIVVSKLKRSRRSGIWYSIQPIAQSSCPLNTQWTTPPQHKCLSHCNLPIVKRSLRIRSGSTRCQIPPANGSFSKTSRGNMLQHFLFLKVLAKVCQQHIIKGIESLVLRWKDLLLFVFQIIWKQHRWMLNTPRPSRQEEWVKIAFMLTGND